MAFTLLLQTQSFPFLAPLIPSRHLTHTHTPHHACPLRSPVSHPTAEATTTPEPSATDRRTEAVHPVRDRHPQMGRAAMKASLEGKSVKALKQHKHQQHKHQHKHRQQPNGDSTSGGGGGISATAPTTLTTGAASRPNSSSGFTAFAPKQRTASTLSSARSRSRRRRCSRPLGSVSRSRPSRTSHARCRRRS